MITPRAADRVDFTARPGAIRVLVIEAHPREGSFCEAVAKSFARGARSRGATLRYVTLRHLSFDLNARGQTLEPQLEEVQASLRWAQHLAFIYPTWWGVMPALLKGFLDRMLPLGFAFELRPEGGWRGLLGGRSAQIITTMDTPPFVFRWLLGAPGIRALRDATLGFCGIRPTRVRLLGPIHSSSLAQRRRWLAEVARLGRTIDARLRSGFWAKTRAWLAAARVQFYVFPSLTLSAGALLAGGEFRLVPYLSACACAALVEFITVLTNELHDHATDRANVNSGTFTGGSRVLVEGRLSARELKRGRAIAGGLLAAAMCLFGTGSPSGIAPFLALLGAGLVLGIGYTAPPLRLAYRGLGELDVAFTHSALVLMLGYVSQGGPPGDPAPWLIAAPIFFAVLPSIILAGFPDFEADAASGKRTLAVKLGRLRATQWAAGSAIFSLILFAAIAGRGAGSLVFIAAAIAHGALLLRMTHLYVTKGARPGRIDGLLIVALSFMMWFAIEPLVRFWPGVR